ncbi:MAG: transcriptional regulator [Candidatus Magasanikbacteria bacterium RIFCSPHIGHO2_02_FULL_51_14]|uniref:Transcriptional regulator n=1 Tax=Candidatus Magasanikbacteria bacterium RIFCSPHIGHO2_02_FULL_51_14 TaxID=1798683 RepID=A0A1F6MHI1_9BACT|nr:MAG: transcriptional regulator [Candidatus Magasanikbacteria bacterium RIFCSPHIGHO2_02_FULL_51_14]
MNAYAKVKKQLLKDDKVRKAYADLGPEFAMISAIIEKRMQKGLTQAALARRVGTKQSAIARLESGTHNPTIEFLQKVAKALDTQLRISLS